VDAICRDAIDTKLEGLSKEDRREDEEWGRKYHRRRRW
jgi:hypothetical protein